jgi:hypothetical protein
MYDNERIAARHHAGVIYGAALTMLQHQLERSHAAGVARLHGAGEVATGLGVVDGDAKADIVDPADPDHGRRRALGGQPLEQIRRARALAALQELQPVAGVAVRVGGWRSEIAEDRVRLRPEVGNERFGLTGQRQADDEQPIHGFRLPVLRAEEGSQPRG